MMKLKCFDCIKDIFYPRRCIYCNTTVKNFKRLCICQKCKNIRNYPHVVRDDRYLFTEAFGVLKYDDNIKTAMLKFKFKGLKYYGYTFAERMSLYQETFPYLKTAVLCCVPISESREREYNQTQIIAKHLGKILGNECVSDLLYKARDIKPLSKMNKAQRRLFVKGAFAVNPKYDLIGKDVVVVDDIFTSGATANECAKVLRSAGAKNVYIACACYN